MTTPVADAFKTATLIRVHNPFDVSEQERELLPLSQDVKLGELITVEEHHSVSVNGRLFEHDDWREYTVIDGDYVVLCPVPGGGGGGKNILRIVALVAISIAAPMAAAGMLSTTVGAMTAGGWALSAGITIAGSMIVNSLIPIEQSLPESKSLESSSPSYGIDGPKNSATEGIPVPVVYGTYRVGGNIIQLHTENGSGDEDGTQFLYLAYALSEGEVAGIDTNTIEINDQPYVNFSDVRVLSRVGTATQLPMPWFDDTISPYNVGVTLSTTWHRYTTQTAVDKLRVDIVAPNGFRRINDQGESLAITRGFQIRYRRAGTSEPWRAVTAEKASPTGTKRVAKVGGVTYDLDNLPPSFSVAGNKVYQTETYHRQSSRTWSKDGYSSSPPGYSSDIKGGGNNGWTAHHSNSKGGETSFTRQVLVGTVENTTVYTQQTKIYGKYTSAYRRSFAWSVPGSGLYEIEVKRDVAESEDGQIIDRLQWADTNEITVSDIGYRHTALLGLGVRLNDQLSSRPKVTVVVHGRKVRVPAEWYSVGEPWTVQHSTNPAWIALDALTNSRYGAGFGDHRINFHDWMKWAAYCDQEGLEFNGTFDTDSNFWDSLAHVFRCGRAKIVPQGVKFGVAIERPEFPAMMFNVSNMVKASLSINWLSMSDRANEIQATYYDENNSYKATALKVVSPVLQQGATPRVVNLNLIGVTNAEQARREAQLLLNMNRFIQQTITFEAPVESLACRIGSLVLVQHDIPQWGFGGRTLAGSTDTSIKLDRPVTMEAGKNYSLLLNFDSLVVSSGSLGGRINDYNFYLDDSYGREGAHSLIVGGEEYRVQAIYAAGDGVRRILTLEDACPAVGNEAYELHRLDALEERAVTTVAGEHDTLTLTSALPMAPGAYVKWLFGVMEGSQKQFRVLAIEGEGLDTRKLTCVEYYDGIYAYDDAVAEPPNYSALSGVAQVTDLTIAQVRKVIGGISQPVARLEWSAPDNYNGAIVYMKADNENWQQVARLANAQLFYEHTNLLLGETVTFRVVGINSLGSLAPKDDAPTVSLVITAAGDVLEPPTVTTVQYTSTGILLEWQNVDSPLYARVEIVKNNVDDVSGATRIFLGDAEQYTDNNVVDGEQAYYWLRTLNADSVAGAYSPSVTPGPLGQISNLRLKTPFIGDTAHITWDAQPGAARYVVEVYTKAVLRRTETVTFNTYQYGIADAISDGDVDRDITFVVAAKAVDGTIYPTSSLAVHNPPPALPTNLSLVAGFKIATLNFTPPSDPDYVDTLVWMGTTTGFTPDESTEVAAIKGGPITVTGLNDNQGYYFRLTCRDVWGAGVTSAEYDGTTLDLSEFEGLSPWAYVTQADRDFIEANLENDAIPSEKIVSLTASRITTGTLAATEKISCEGQVESVAGAMSVTMGPKLIDSKVALFSIRNGSTTLMRFNEDGSSEYTGPVTITGGTGYVNLSDKPSSLADVNAGEGSKLDGIEAGADVTGNNTANNTNNVGGSTAAAVSAAAINFNSRNDRNGAGIFSPVISTTGTAVDHVIATDGSANISFEWTWGGDEPDIDGFIVYVRQSTSSSAYTFGSSPSSETTFYVAPDRRALFLYGVAANQYYSFAVQAYRVVDPDINASGMIKSALVKATRTEENPYRPSATVAFSGDLTGTINGASAASVRANAEAGATFTSTDAGVLAYQDAVDYGDISGAKPPIDATHGADWATTLTGIPDRISDSASVGLNLTATHMGYYNGTDWGAYIKDDGTFFFGDLAAGQYLDFDGTKLQLGPNTSIGNNNDIAVTVGPTGDFATLNAALEALSRTVPAYKPGGFNAIISIQSSYTAFETIDIVGVDLSWITITKAEPLSVNGTLVFGYWWRQRNARGPIIDFDIDIVGGDSPNNDPLFMIEDGSHLAFTENRTIHGRVSPVYNQVFHIQASRVKLNLLSIINVLHCIRIFDGAYLEINYATFSGNYGYALNASASEVRAFLATVNNIKDTAGPVVSLSTCSGSLSNLQIQGPGSYSGDLVYLSDSVVDLGGCDIHGYTTPGVDVLGGVVQMSGSRVTRVAGGGTQSGTFCDVRVINGGIVQSRSNAVFGANIGFNTLTANGIIMKS